MTKAKTTPTIDFESYVDFHGILGWYVGDCYSAETQKQLKKLKATTYTVSIGNITVHYFSNELPKYKDFKFPGVQLPMTDEKFWKALRAYVRSNKRFIKGDASKEINKLKKKTI